MFKKAMLIAVSVFLAVIAVFFYQKIGNLSEELVRVRKELDEKSQDMYSQLDSQMEKVTGNIAQLKKEGYVEPADLSSISAEISVATVLVANPKDIENIKEAGQSLVVETVDLTNAGTGFIIKEDGYIITAKHVVDVIGAENIAVLTQNGKSFKAKLIQQSDESDIALLKIDGRGFFTVKIGYFDNVNIGDKIGFIGFSLNTGITKAIVYEGSVSAKGTDESGVKIIGINAFVNRGNSGGPVFSLKAGRVIGMLSSRQRDISEEKFIVLPQNYQPGFQMGAIDPLKLNIDLYNETVKLVGDMSQVGIGIAVSTDELNKLIK